MAGSKDYSGAECVVYPWSIPTLTWVCATGQQQRVMVINFAYAKFS